jgi:hypothetical protein
MSTTVEVRSVRIELADDERIMGVERQARLH